MSTSVGENLYYIIAFYKNTYCIMCSSMSEKCMYVKMYIRRDSVNGSLFIETNDKIRL